MVERGEVSNRQALEEFLAARPSVPPLLAELARSLAREVDDPPENGLSSGIAKEYKALCERLIADDSAGPGTLGDLFAEVGDST